MSGDAVPSSPFLASCYAGELMMKARKSISILAAGVAVLSLSAFVAPAASADDAAVVTSSRSFKGQQSRSVDFLKESTSVSVEDKSSYGGIESLNVPKTKSEAQREAENKAKQEKEAAKKEAEEAARMVAQAQSQSVSRSSSRSSQSASSSSSSSVAAGAEAATSDVRTMVTRALSVMGSGYQSSGYVYTGSNATSRFTCSGLVDYALGLPSNSHWPESFYAQVSNKTTDVSQLKYGDLVFYNYGGRNPGHVGIYLGNGQIVDSAPNGGVAVRDVNFMPFIGGGSIL